jgi:hypothetical protein
MSSLNVELSLYLIIIVYAVIGVPPLYSGYQFIIIFGLLMVVTTEVGGSAILAAKIIISAESKLSPTELRD